MATPEPLEQVLALVRLEPARADDRAEVAGQLQRLCRAAARELSAIGVGLSVMSSDGVPLTVAASSPASQDVEELQFVVGEGPCLDAYRSGGPVLVPDLAEPNGTRWPGYALAAQELGIRAVFAFPLQVGAARLGALDVYRDQPGALATNAVGTAVDFAELAIHWLLDTRHVSDAADPVIDDALENRMELYQAQGMVMIQLAVDMPTAMSRLRAYAYAHNVRLSQVAADVVARKLTFEVDDG